MINSSFYYHQGGLRGDDPQITLTAFVLIALAEAKQAGISCNDPNVNLEVNTNVVFLLFYPFFSDTLNYLFTFIILWLFWQSVMLRTADYLKNAIEQSSRRPYTVAIASYALVLLKKPQRYNPLSVLMRSAAES